MDFVMGMLSLVKDMKSIDQQYRNLNIQLKYLLDKSTRLLNKIDSK